MPFISVRALLLLLPVAYPVKEHTLADEANLMEAEFAVKLKEVEGNCVEMEGFVEALRVHWAGLGFVCRRNLRGFYDTASAPIVFVQIR